MSEIATAMFEAGREASKLEWEVYERLCTLFGEDTVNDTGHDEYDWSLEVYMGDVPTDWVCTKEQRDTILSWGFGRFWVNFQDETEQYCTEGHLGVRKKAAYPRKRGKRVAQPEAVTGRNAARYLWLRENGEQGIYVLRNWKQGDPTPPLELAQGEELDTVIDEYLSGKRIPQQQPEGDSK